SGNDPVNYSLPYAYAALSIDPNGAYIHNRLALLHLDAKNYDSAFFYARKATQLAPKWTCALATLSKVEQAKPGSPKLDSVTKEKLPGKTKFGSTLGIGYNTPTIQFDKANWRQGNVDYNDSLANITTGGGTRIDVGLF